MTSQTDISVLNRAAELEAVASDIQAARDAYNSLPFDSKPNERLTAEARLHAAAVARDELQALRLQHPGLLIDQAAVIASFRALHQHSNRGVLPPHLQDRGVELAAQLHALGMTATRHMREGFTILDHHIAGTLSHERQEAYAPLLARD